MSDRPLVIGKGSKWEIKPGVWQYRHNLGKDPVTGKYRYSPKRTIHTRKKSEVNAALEAYKQELNSGTFVKRDKRTTVGDYAEKFHALQKTRLAPTAHKSEMYTMRYVQDMFGGIPLQDLKSATIKETYADKLESGKYTENQIFKANVFLRQIMKEAQLDELIAKNPCDKVKVPRPTPKERQALDAEQFSSLYSLVLSEEPSPLNAATLLMLDTGMRRGEALGLTWEYCDLESGTVFTMNQYTNDLTPRAPKSKTSRRRISLSTRATAALASWKQFQEEELAKMGLAQTPSTPVVHDLDISADGSGRVTASRMNPNRFDKIFRNWCTANGYGTYTLIPREDANGKAKRPTKHYEGLTPHMLRHTQATLLIGNNTDIKTVQNRLGHSQVGTTLNIYSHAIAANDAKAASTIDDLIGCGD